MSKKIAIASGGGSIKGAVEAGSLRACLEHGITPDILTSISVGAHNNTFIANAIGKQKRKSPTGKLDWESVGGELWNFWLGNIKKPSDVAIPRNALRLAYDVWRNKFNGLTDTSPLRKLLYKTVSINNLYTCPTKLFVGAVNVSSGKIVYAEPSYTQFLQYVMASSAIPILMPVEKIGMQPFLDGGLRDNAPIGMAIKQGADEIIVIANHPKNLGAVEINTGNLMQLVDRLMDIIVHNTLENDIWEAQLINKLLVAQEHGAFKNAKTQEEQELAEYLKNKRSIKITIIRPEVPINVNLDDFNSKDIEMMLNSGYQTANKVLQRAYK